MKPVHALALALALPLAACSDAPTWQVVAVHTDPAEPGALLADAAGLANFHISDTELDGNTACADLQASIRTEDDTFTIEEVEVGDAGNCEGGARHVHEQLTGILVPGAQFRTEQLTDTELLWTSTSDEVDPPSVRLMSL
ncbi:hypothetical protein [Corynebacterium sp. HMSC071B10]|uniref:hypothetical protein n=1 Tax=Corynebacterium sp. HMSC071B10 TaxID=1739494 RepID=UPI0008BE4548|nr:hypothetical protein [Corynebacterium sp. HMSC071B10]OFP35204.1 hypothetical protein HMPREF2990_09160 [Corynebacterium sp. HMSC071B10]